MLLSVEPRDSFDVEPGRYRAVCSDIREIEKQTRKGPQTFLRVIFNVGLRHDIINPETQKQGDGWKGIRALDHLGIRNRQSYNNAVCAGLLLW